MTSEGHDRTAPQQLAVELADARAALVEALADVAPELLTTPGLVGDWSARELIAHLGYWTGHAAEALHFAQEGRADEFGAADLDVDERNAVVARVARETDLPTVRKREEAAFGALIDALAGLDPALLNENMAYGDTLEQVIRDDGSDHYREHAIDIRAWFTGDDEPDDDEPEAGESS